MQPRSLYELRHRAERRVGPKEHSFADKISNAYDLEALVHELQVHQVELEMQNEELHGAKTEMEESRNKYFELFDSAPVGYVTLDPQGRIQEANLTFAGFLGRPRGDLLQQPFRCYVTPEQRQAFLVFCRKLATAVTAQTCELQLVGPYEKILDVHVKGSSAPGAPNKKGHDQVRLVLMDVTAQRQAEREQASL